MDEALRKWRPALIVLGATVVVVGLFVAFRGTDATPTPTTTNASTNVPDSATTATSEVGAPATVAASVVTPPPPLATASPSAPPPPTLADGEVAPPVPGEGSIFVPPEPKPITPDWQAAKTEKALAAVKTRSDLLEKEIAALEKAGKTEEAAEKKVLLKRLATQMADMKVEIAQFKADAGIADDAAPSK